MACCRFQHIESHILKHHSEFLPTITFVCIDSRLLLWFPLRSNEPNPSAVRIVKWDSNELPALAQLAVAPDVIHAQRNRTGRHPQRRALYGWVCKRCKKLFVCINGIIVKPGTNQYELELLGAQDVANTLQTQRHWNQCRSNSNGRCPTPQRSDEWGLIRSYYFKTIKRSPERPGKKEKEYLKIHHQWPALRL